MQQIGTFNNEVRLHVMRRVIETGRVPLVNETALALSRPPAEVAVAHRQLAEQHVFVLEPGSSELRMASPFSAVPTGFEVRIGKRQWWGNCIWDALGIGAALHEEAHIFCHCPDCGDSLSLSVSGPTVSGKSGLVHFAVPAAKWWDDIIYT